MKTRNGGYLVLPFLLFYEMWYNKIVPGSKNCRKQKSENQIV